MTGDIRELQSYRDLLASLEPRPIHDEVGADVVRNLIDALTDLPELTEGQRDFVALLVHLLTEWEEEHYGPVEIAPHELVKNLLEDNDVPPTALVGPVFPNQATVSAFLAGQRPPSYESVQKLAAFFHISPAAFYPQPQRGSGQDLVGQP